MNTLFHKLTGGILGREEWRIHLTHSNILHTHTHNFILISTEFYNIKQPHRRENQMKDLFNQVILEATEVLLALLWHIRV